MKVEIELSYIEALKKQINELEKENARMSDELKSLMPEELRKQAGALAIDMLKEINSKVFKELGFDSDPFGDVRFKENVVHFLGEDWFKSDRLYVELGATITTEYKNAFLRLGIKTK